MTFLTGAPLFFVLSATLTESSVAQGIRPASFDSVRMLKLDSVGAAAKTYFRPQHRVRALEVHALLTEFVAYYREPAGLEVVLRVAVLDSADWRRVANTPYGLPTNSGLSGTNLLLEAVTPPQRIGSRDMPSGEVYDFLTVGHEGGHLLMWQQLPADMRAAIASDETPSVEMMARFQNLGRLPIWYGEMVATYFATAFLEARHPEGAAAWQSHLRKIASIDRPRFTHLDDWGTRVMRALAPDSTPYPFSAEGGRNMDWYQGVVGQVATHVYKHAGLGFISNLRSVLALPNGPNTPELVTQLDSLAPGVPRLLGEHGAQWQGQ